MKTADLKKLLAKIQKRMPHAPTYELEELMILSTAIIRVLKMRGEL